MWLCGIVQLLFLQNWSLAMGRAMPVNSASCENSKNCSDIKIIVKQIQSMISQMQTKAQDIYDDYMSKNPLTNESFCNPESFHPNLTIQGLSKEETMVELLKISIFLRDALYNVTVFQKNLSNPTDLIEKLNNTVTELKVIISNLNCFHCQTKKWLQVATGNYNVDFDNKNLFTKKIIACRLIMKYKNFISQAAKIDLESLFSSD